MGKKKMDCFKCSHFYVTWDRSFPYGCRAIGFKTRNMPSDDVYKASGRNCLGFKLKSGPPLKS
ncbi:MAG: uracil-DNA glycosylase [Nitrospirae bacterium]|nr:uracil-DNA glycosylase [Nitrospirota bacterium]